MVLRVPITIAPGIDVSDDEVSAICRKYGMKEPSAFGSAATGELRPDSDVDLLVEFLSYANQFTGTPRG